MNHSAFYFYFLLIVLMTQISVKNVVESARILAVVPTPSHSHELAFRAIWEELAKRGHEVVLMTTTPKLDKNLLPNLREIDWSFAHKMNEDHDMSKLKVEAGGNIIKVAMLYIESRTKILYKQMNHPEVQALLKNETEHFDLVIAEFATPVIFGFVHHFKAPFIGIMSNEIPYFINSIIGNDNHFLNPDIMTGYNSETLFDKLKLFFKRIGMQLVIDYFFMPHVEGLIKETFGEDCPVHWELCHKVDLIISIHNPALHPIRPIVPANVQVSGLNLQQEKPLNKEMQKYMDGSKNGVIYFSLGSSVNSKDISKETLDVIKDTFRELPYDILWKFELSELEEKPDNVKIVKWAQQQDILRHPNLKLFITQGGLQSIEEALYTYNPMLVLPVAGDQDYNAKMVVDKGYGLELNIKKLEKESFKQTILELINNPTYKNRVKEMVNLAKDEPMTSLERAVWWIEYVIRNKGAKHLKGPGIDMPLYQYLMLDVIAVCLTILIITIYASYLIIKFTLLKLKKTIINTNKKNN